MMMFHFTAILRHNTSMASDVDLARREWSALVGQPGGLLSEGDLRRTLGVNSATAMPILARNVSWVAATWPFASIQSVISLLRQSAFVQEVFIRAAEIAALRTELERAAGSIFAATERFTEPLIVGLGHNYIIETEGVLSSDVSFHRMAAVIRALLEPYILKAETNISKVLRNAKKTTLSLSHDLHIYKGKFFPRMARALINIYGRGSMIFDPYCGSGTALLESSLLGQASAGIDIDPICAMISRSKVTPFIGRRSDVQEGLDIFRRSIARKEIDKNFHISDELHRKIGRRDTIDGTNYLDEIKQQAAVLHAAVKTVPKGGIVGDLIATLASDAVTKKIRYRFVGVGNGRYTIEITKQPLLDRLMGKIRRSLQLIDVFHDLTRQLLIEFGSVGVLHGDARSNDSWPSVFGDTLVLTSPPYLPASSGREHYTSSRALAFAILGAGRHGDGYFDSVRRVEAPPSFDSAPEAERLLTYLASDADDAADPQRDAMRFERKAVPTAYYLEDIRAFGACLRDGIPAAKLALVVADRHTFYSHRRGEIEHVVDCAALYGELLSAAGYRLSEEIELQLLKSAASRARPRAKDAYHEAVLLFDPPGAESFRASSPPIVTLDLDRIGSPVGH